MAAAIRARPPGARTTSATPRTRATKNAYWWITPRSRGLTGSGRAAVTAIGATVARAARDPDLESRRSHEDLDRHDGAGARTRVPPDRRAPARARAPRGADGPGLLPDHRAHADARNRGDGLRPPRRGRPPGERTCHPPAR